MRAFSLRVVDVQSAGGTNQRVVSAYLHGRNISSQAFSEELVSLLSRHAGFDWVYFVGRSEQLGQARDWLREGELISERLARAAGRSCEEFTRFLSLDAEGRCLTHLGMSPFITRDPTLAERVGRSVLQKMFCESDALVDSPPGTHYVKPSGRHTNKFVRAARVLEGDLNVSEITFWLLSIFGKCRAVSQILVDTSGILAIAHSLAYEAVSLGWLTDLPTIRTHNSYGGLNALALPNPTSTACLISASTSGELEARLANIGVPRENIFTLYYLGDPARAHKGILCDLTESQHNPLGYAAVRSFSEADCSLCKAKSLPIRMSGDQFVLEQPKVVEIEITASDLQQREEIDALAGTGFFKVFRGGGSEACEIFLDVETLYGPDGLAYQYDVTQRFKQRANDKLSGYLRRGLPVHTRRIVHGSHPYSSKLATQARDIFSSFQDSDKISILKSTELMGAGAIPESASLVVSACFEASNELMTINMQLRGLQPSGNTTYVALFYRCEGRLERERVRRTVTFGENRAESFNFYTVTDLFLPRCLSEHSWRKELKVLELLEHTSDMEGEVLPPDIPHRINLLRSAPSRGIANDLFWGSANGTELRLQNDFVFLETNGRIASISQADVFVVVASILHSLRCRSDDRQLACGPYKKAVLSPENFVRFNDPVLHAAILRAARGYDLAYANCGDEISRRGKNIIERQIESARARKPDALMEFLLALESRRMTLHRDHVEEICKKVIYADELPRSFRMLAAHILRVVREPDCAGQPN